MERTDGFGTRRIEGEARAGVVETLQLAPALTTPAAERAIRQQMGRTQDTNSPAIVQVGRVERDGPQLAAGPFRFRDIARRGGRRLVAGGDVVGR